MRKLFLILFLIALLGASLQHEEFDEKIVGGSEAKIEDYPYQLGMEFKDIFFCGASLLTPNIAVTAAHCTDPVKDHLENVLVRAGTSIRKQGGQVAKVTKICPNPKYIPNKNEDYDVSVIKLDRSLKLNKAVRVIALREKGNQVPDGTIGTATGWGATSSGGKESEHLLKIDVPKVKESICKSAYKRYTDRMECYGYKEGGKDSCTGDSGGPLAIGGKLGGIISFGGDCGDPRKPGVYTKITHSEVHDYITNCVKQFS